MSKIVIIGSAHPLRGGLATYNERLCRAFNEQGHDCSIFTFSLQYPSFLFPGKTQYSTEPAPANTPIEIKVNSVNPLNWISVGRELKKMRPDLIIIKYWLPFMALCFGTIARIAKQNKHTKVICIVDNMIPHEKRPGDNALTNYFTKSIDGFIAMSDQVLNDISVFDTQKPRLFCPHPLYDNFGEALSKKEAKKHLGLADDFEYFLFFGFIRDYKGLDLLLKAFADERFRGKKIKLLIAGEFYSNSKQYMDQIHELKLENDLVLRTDFIPDSEVRYYFSACNMVVQPYKHATQSGVTQIAYHFNKPMLVTNVGGLAELVPHNKVGYVVEPNPADITNALLDFINNDRETKFAENVAVEKKKYGWDSMTNAILNIYKQTKK